MTRLEKAHLDYERAAQEAKGATRRLEEASLRLEHSMECARRLGDWDIYTVWPVPGWEHVVGEGLVSAGPDKGPWFAVRHALQAMAEELKCKVSDLAVKPYMLVAVCPWGAVDWPKDER